MSRENTIRFLVSAKKYLSCLLQHFTTDGRKLLLLLLPVLYHVWLDRTRSVRGAVEAENTKRKSFLQLAISRSSMQSPFMDQKSKLSNLNGKLPTFFLPPDSIQKSVCLNDSLLNRKSSL